MKTRLASGTDVRHLIFWCPGCDEPHAPTIEGNAPWTWNGDRERPTLSPSLKVSYHDGRLCHSYVRDGQIQFLDDCTHALKGQTVPIPEWPRDNWGGLDEE
jgi:hypothetical protein